MFQKANKFNKEFFRDINNNKQVIKKGPTYTNTY